MTTIYLIPGMGADRRIYNNIDLGESYEAIPIDWIESNAVDTLATYAQKLVRHYLIKPDSIIIGNSLGGMLAIEIGKLIPLNKIVLISSIRAIDEAPAYFALFRYLPVYKLIPGSLMVKFDFLLELAFGQMENQDKRLFKDMLKKTSPVFLKWSMGAVLHWDNHIIPPNVCLIAGDKDMVFDCRRMKEAEVVKGGTHIMIFDKAKQVNEILKRILPA